MGALTIFLVFIRILTGIYKELYLPQEYMGTIFKRLLL